MQLEIGKKYRVKGYDNAWEVTFIDGNGIGWGPCGDEMLHFRINDPIYVVAWFDGPDVGEGYRSLSQDEPLQVGDEFWQPNDGWRPILIPHCKKFMFEFYRRSTAPKYVPYEWEDRHVLFGRRFRFKDINLEKIITNCRFEHNVFYIDGMAEEAFLKSCEWIDGTPCGKVAN
jgi:hypothetical protein